MFLAMSTSDWIAIALFLFAFCVLVAWLRYWIPKLLGVLVPTFRQQPPPTWLSWAIGGLSAMALLFLLAVTTPYFTHAPAGRQELDDSPVRPPEPLLSVRDREPKELLRVFAAALEAREYTTTVHDHDFTIEAMHSTGRNKGYDSIVLWFTRDIEDPSHIIHVFLLHERFEEVLSARSGIYRIKLDDRERRLVAHEIETSLRNAMVSPTVSR
jgi:hypothetical protein